MIAFARDFDGQNPLFPKRSFELTDAVEVHDSRFFLESGYTTFQSEFPELELQVPGILAAQTRHRIIPSLIALLDIINPPNARFDLVIDSFITEDHKDRTSKMRENIPPDQMKSVIASYQDLLLNDGTRVFAIASQQGECEVQLDDHKLMIIYFSDQTIGKRIEETLKRFGLQNSPQLPTVLDVDHSHKNKIHHQEALNQLESRLKMTSLRDYRGL